MNFVTRAQWGAKPATKPPTRLVSVKGAGFHWEGPRMGWPWDHGLCDDKVRGIQRFHQQDRQWSDIAYSFLYCGHGYAYEGRGWGNRTAANGTNFGNDYFHAFCYLGGEGDAFTAGARVVANDLVEEQYRRFPRSTDIRPHSGFKATACPGNAIREWLANGRPVAGGTPTQGDDDMTPEQAAWLGNLHHEVVAEGARLDRVEDLLAATRYESALTQQKLDRLIAKLQA